MAWIRKRSAVFALVILAYFYILYFRRDNFTVLTATIVFAVATFGGAIADRMSFDPSAIYIDKPWRYMRPSAGDGFRLFIFSIVTVFTLPLGLASVLSSKDYNLIECGLISAACLANEAARYYIGRVRWHGTTIEVRTKFAQRVSIRWTDIRSVERQDFGDYIVFRDNSRQIVRIDRRSRGYSEFMRDAERYVPAPLQMQIRAMK